MNAFIGRVAVAAAAITDTLKLLVSFTLISLNGTVKDGEVGE